MGLDEPGQDGPPAEVDDERIGAREGEDLGVPSHRQDAIVGVAEGGRPAARRVGDPGRPGGRIRGAGTVERQDGASVEDGVVWVIAPGV